MADPLVVSFARMGELSSILTIVSPLPEFISCHKPDKERFAMLKSISFNYLLALWVMNTTWVAYAIKAHLDDIIAINLLGMVSALIFILLYLQIKFSLTLPRTEVVGFICTVPYTVFIFTNAFSTELTGILAMILNLLSYVTILDSLNDTLSTKDPETINLVVTLSAGFNSSAWTGYAFLINDFFIFLPCFLGFLVFLLNMYLYMWTIGIFADDNFIINILKNQFLKSQEISIDKVKIEMGEKI